MMKKVALAVALEWLAQLPPFANATFQHCYVMLRGTDQVLPRFYVPQPDKMVNGARTWAQVNDKRGLDYNYGIYWAPEQSPPRYFIYEHGTRPNNGSAKIMGGETQNAECLEDGKKAQWWLVDRWVDAGSILRQADARHTACAPVKGRPTVPTVLLKSDAHHFRECLQAAFQSEEHKDKRITGVHHEVQGKRCYGVIDQAFPPDAVDGADWHISCTIEDPVEMKIEPSENLLLEELWHADNMKDCYDMVRARSADDVHGALLLPDGMCSIVKTPMNHLRVVSDENESALLFSPVIPVKPPTAVLTKARVEYEDCYVVVEGSSRVEPYLFAPLTKITNGARTWGSVGRYGDGQLQYGWGIYWSDSWNPSHFQFGGHGPRARNGQITTTSADHPTPKDLKCFVDGTPVRWNKTPWTSAGTLQVLKDPRHAACAPQKGRLTVPTVELAKDVTTFRDCLAIAFDEHNDKLITALHFDMAAKTCNAVIGVEVPDIKAVIDGAGQNTSCSLAIPTEIHGDLTKDNATEEVGDAADIKTCHELVWRRYGKVAHAALLKDGKCKAITERVKGFEISENGGSIMAPVAPVERMIEFQACSFINQRTDFTNLFVPLQFKKNNEKTWGVVSAPNRKVRFDWGGFWRASPAQWAFGEFKTGHRSHYVSGQSGTECLAEGSTVGHWASTPSGVLTRIHDFRATLCPPIFGKMTLPTTLLGEADSFRDCVEMALTKTDLIVTGVYEDLNEKKCYIVVNTAIPSIESVIDTAEFGHVSCSFDGPLDMAGGLYKSDETAKEDVGTAGSVRECHDMVVAKFGQTAPAMLLHGDGKCQAVTGTVHGFEVNEDDAMRVSMVSPFPPVQFDDDGTTTAEPTTVAGPVTTTTAAPTTTVAGPVKCDAANVNLEFAYIQEHTLSYCGETTCFLHANGDAQLAKQRSVKDNLFPMMEELKGQFKSVKMTYAEFCDKNIEPFGQSNVDFCYKFFNSLKPYDAEYREWIEDHWERKWPHSASGMDMLENQLDAFISTVQRANYSTASHDEDGNLNLRIALMLTDKGFHDYGDVREQFPDCKLDGQELCREYQIDNVGCQCVGYEYPSIEQLMDVLSEKQVNPIILLGEPVDDSVYAAYTSLNVNVAEASAGQLSGVVMAPQNDSLGFNGAAVQAAVEALCVFVQSLED